MLISLTLGPAAVVATILRYLVIMFVEGQILVPKIEGGAFSFHPALVLFLVVAGREQVMGQPVPPPGDAEIPAPSGAAGATTGEPAGPRGEAGAEA